MAFVETVARGIYVHENGALVSLNWSNSSLEIVYLNKLLVKKWNLYLRSSFYLLPPADDDETLPLSLSSCLLLSSFSR